MISTGIYTELIRGDVFYWGALMAATLIPAIPLALLYNTFLDRFIAGFTGGAFDDDKSSPTKRPHAGRDDHEEPEGEVTGARTTRREILKRGAAGGLLIVYGGAATKTAAAGAEVPPPGLAGTLRIIQWSHFVPAYEWFDKIYVKRWGQANDTEVIVDHINQADIPARAAAEVAAQSGHDLFFFLSPPAAYEDQVIDHANIVQEVTKKRGRMKQVAFKATYNEDEEVLRLLGQLRPRSRQLPDRSLGRGRAQADIVGQRAEGGAEAPRHEGTRSASGCRTRSTRTWP